MSSDSPSNGGQSLNEKIPLKGLSFVSSSWSNEELKGLKEGLLKYPADRYSLIVRYAKIAATLPHKTVRDVAIQCKKQANFVKSENDKQKVVEVKHSNGGKKRRADDVAAMKKGQVKKERSYDPLHMRPPLLPAGVPTGLPAGLPAGVAGVPTGMPAVYGIPPPPLPTLPPYVPPEAGMAKSDAASTLPASSHQENGKSGDLLRVNDELLGQIRSNHAMHKVFESTELFVRIRDNIQSILNGMTTMPGIMSQMPPLPVKLNLDLLNSMLIKGPPSP